MHSILTSITQILNPLGIAQMSKSEYYISIQFRWVLHEYLTLQTLHKYLALQILNKCLNMDIAQISNQAII